MVWFSFQSLLIVVISLVVLLKDLFANITAEVPTATEIEPDINPDIGSSSLSLDLRSAIDLAGIEIFNKYNINHA